MQTLTVLDLQQAIISNLLIRMCKTYCRICGRHKTRLGNLTCITSSQILPKLKSYQAFTEPTGVSEPVAMDVKLEDLELHTLMICKHCRIVISTRRGMRVAIRGTSSRCTARLWEDSMVEVVICTRAALMQLLLKEEVKVAISCHRRERLGHFMVSMVSTWLDKERLATPRLQKKLIRGWQELLIRDKMIVG